MSKEYQRPSGDLEGRTGLLLVMFRFRNKKRVSAMGDINIQLGDRKLITSIICHYQSACFCRRLAGQSRLVVYLAERGLVVAVACSNTKRGERSWMRRPRKAVAGSRCGSRCEAGTGVARCSPRAGAREPRAPRFERHGRSARGGADLTAAAGTRMFYLRQTLRCATNRLVGAAGAGGLRQSRNLRVWDLLGMCRRGSRA